MGDTTLIAVGTGTITAIAALLGHTLGQLHRLRDNDARRERQIAALNAALDALAESYDPQPQETPEQLRRRFRVIEGALLPTAPGILRAAAERVTRRRMRLSLTPDTKIAKAPSK